MRPPSNDTYCTLLTFDIMNLRSASALGGLDRRHRAPTAELPTTAALVGGLVAQEAIKVITRQYVPIDGTCVVDLVASTTGTIKV